MPCHQSKALVLGNSKMARHALHPKPRAARRKRDQGAPPASGKQERSCLPSVLVVRVLTSLLQGAAAKLLKSCLLCWSWNRAQQLWRSLVLQRQLPLLQKDIGYRTVADYRTHPGSSYVGRVYTSSVPRVNRWNSQAEFGFPGQRLLSCIPPPIAALATALESFRPLLQPP